MTGLQHVRGAFLTSAVSMLALVVLAACGGETDAVLETAAPEAAVPALSETECGPTLPVTGLCSNAVPSLFLKIDTQAPKLATRCVWRTQEVSLTPTDALVFRAQDCTAEGWVPNAYEVVQNYVKYRMDGTPSDQAMFMLEFMPLTDGETAEQAAMKTLARAPEDQRARCETRALAGYTLAGEAFELAPNAELAAEMDALNQGEPWDACGPNGVTMDAVQFWEARRTYALFHMLGQDDPPWDPASFTFYRKVEDGAWIKAG
jgi:hypothetical protein